MSTAFYDLTESDRGFNYRWVQPPQVTYLVCTVDVYGNHNVTPVTLGTCVGANSLPNPVGSNYYYAFCVGSADVPNIPPRDAFYNLEAVPECVISYPGPALIDEIWATALPIPAGIEELDVARLTPLPSRKVRPAGIAECPINIEARVESSYPIGEHYRLYICQVVGVSVERDLLAEDEANPLRFGIMGIDPVFEVAIARQGDLPPRLYFGQIDRERLIRTADDMGSSVKWVGTFEEWIEDEARRGKIGPQEREEIMRLYDAWRADPDPSANGEVKRALTERLTRMVWDRG